MTRRRRVLAGLCASLLAGCAVPGGDAERIVEVATGRTITRSELVAVMRASDYALLGELHDNPWHHQRRGALLSALAAPGSAMPAVVAEQLDRGQVVRDGPDLLARLVAAGFDAKGWQWPMHEALFGPILSAGLRLHGGNAPRDLARQIARSGESALPADLRAALDGAPLPHAARDALDADLVEGHCGMLPASRVGLLRAAQRARDAAMWLALRDAGARPAVLIAGNGHVRADFGVPQLAAALDPQARVVTVGFLETGAPVSAAPYRYVWITAAAVRSDPCAGMRPMAPR